MVKFELTEQEATLLHKILDCYLTELSAERATNGIEDLGDVLRGEELMAQQMMAHLKAQGVGILTMEMQGEYAN